VAPGHVAPQVTAPVMLLTGLNQHLDTVEVGSTDCRSSEAATRAATPVHWTGQTPTTANTSALITRSTGRPQTVSTLTEPVS